jgi:YggT family protein
LSAFAADFIDILIWVLTLAIFGRVLLSWISPRGNDPVTPLLYQVTEPILAPLRRLLPQMGMLDLAPMVAILVLNYLIRPLVLQLF